jgi:hypothetical protein
MNPRRLLRRLILLLQLCIVGLSPIPALGYNNYIIPDLSYSNVVYYLSHPEAATAYRFNTTDSAGHEMQCPSVLEIDSPSWKYAAVYHSPTLVGTWEKAFDVNLALSNDLMNWTYSRQLATNATMPKIAQVDNGAWVVLAHEQWMNTDSLGAPVGPSQVAYRLFYDVNDLLNGTIRSTWIAPQFVTAFNGTPSFYNMSLQLINGWWSVGGQYGFHFWNGTGRDLNANTTIVRLFDPTGGTTTYPSTADVYNGSLTNVGAAGSIGQRDTIQTTSARYNIQEGNTSSTNDFANWRIWLYTFGDSYSYPTGNGSVVQLSPQTPGGSTSFGNPSVSIVNRPGGGVLPFLSRISFSAREARRARGAVA